MSVVKPKPNQLLPDQNDLESQPVSKLVQNQNKNQSKYMADYFLQSSENRSKIKQHPG